MESAGAAEGEGDALPEAREGPASPAPGTEERARPRKTASLSPGKRGICLPAERRGGGEGTAARGQRLSQVSEGEGREGAMGEGPERGGSPAEPGTRCDTAGGRAGRATRCGGDSEHRGDSEGTPRRHHGVVGGDLPVPPASLPSSRLLSLTHPLHGFQDQSQFIAGHLRAGSGGRSGARGGEEGAAARPERRSRGGQEEEEKEDEEGASRRCGGSFPRGSRGSDARAGRGGAA